MIGPGDYLQTQVNYTQGALRYAALTPGGAAPPGIFGAPGELGLGFYADGVYCGTSAGGAANAACPTGASSVSLTTVWSVQAAYEHFWTPSLRTSLVGAYTDISYNANATSQLCGALTTNTGGQHDLGSPNRGPVLLRLELLERVFAHPVEHHEGLLRRSGRLSMAI